MTAAERSPGRRRTAKPGPGAGGPIRGCGTCGLCCKVFDIEVLGKPEQSWCPNYGGADVGCAIYGRRPAVCRGFKCRWLVDPEMGEEWRPDRCGFVLTTSKSGLGLWVTPDGVSPLAWRREPYYGRIRQWSEVARTGSGYVGVRQPGRVFVVFPEEEVEVFGFTDGAAIKAGYRVGGGFVRPLAVVRAGNGAIREYLGSAYPERSFARRH